MQAWARLPVIVGEAHRQLQRGCHVMQQLVRTACVSSLSQVERCSQARTSDLSAYGKRIARAEGQGTRQSVAT